jgi:predicted DNA-binding transcriptional regulator YafY
MIHRRRDLANRFIAGEELTARDIVSDYGVTMRTASRDMAALKACGLLEDNPSSKIYRAKKKYLKRVK